MFGIMIGMGFVIIILWYYAAKKYREDNKCSWIIAFMATD